MPYYHTPTANSMDTSDIWSAGILTIGIKARDLISDQSQRDKNTLVKVMWGSKLQNITCSTGEIEDDEETALSTVLIGV